MTKTIERNQSRDITNSEEQTQVKLQDVCIAIVDCEHKTAPIQPTGIPSIRTTNIRNGKLDIANANRVSEETYRQWTARIEPQPEDLILAREAPVGEVGIIPQGHRVCLGQRTVLLRADQSKILPMYLLYALLTPQIRDEMERRSEGALVPHLNVADVRNLLIPSPPSLTEQERIVAILNEQMTAVEKARAATLAQIEAAKALPAAYLRQVFDSPEAQKWKRKKLGDIAETCSGSTPSRERKDYYIGEIPWVKTGELRDSIVHDTGEHISELALRQTSVKLLPAKTLLVAMYGQGQTRGRTGLLAQPATTNQACFAILPNTKEFAPEFLQLWFRHNYSRLREETEGRGGNQPNLNGELLRAQIVCLPSPEEQHQVVLKLNQTEEQTKNLLQSLQDQLEAINKLPAAILRQAFNGEL